MATEAERREESESVVNWAFRNFVEKTVARKGEIVGEADVWMGGTPKVGLTVAEDLQLLVPALVQGQMSAEAIRALLSLPGSTPITLSVSSAYSTRTSRPQI